MATAEVVTQSNTQPGIVKTKEPRWFVEATQKLQAIHNLRPNWDSYGALRPNSLSLNHAAVLLHFVQVQKSPFISPNPAGNVCFEWIDGEESLLVEMTPYGEAKYFISTTDEEAVDVAPFDRIKALVEEL